MNVQRRIQIRLLIVLLIAAQVGCVPNSEHSAQRGGITVIRVSSDVVLDKPPRLGINVGKSTYYNGNDIIAAPLVHGAFHHGRAVRAASVVPETPDTFVEKNHEPFIPNPDHPSLAGGTYYVATGPRAGERGEITGHDPGMGRFTLARGGPMLRDGDVILLQGPTIAHAAPRPESGDRHIGIGDFRVRQHGAEVDFVPDTQGSPNQHVRIRFAGRAGARGGVAHYVRLHAGARYAVLIRARGPEGSRLRVELGYNDLPANDPARLIPLASGRDEALTPDWTDWRFEGRVPESPAIAGGLARLEVEMVDDSAQEGAAYLDHVIMVNLDSATPSGVHAPVVEALRQARCGVLRYLGASSMGSHIEDLLSETPAEASWTMVSGMDGYESHPVYMTARQMLLLAETVGAEPWIVVGAANTPAQWSRLISYLAAPADFDADGALRATHGDSIPWTERFDTIYLEAGNEWWNPVFRPFHITSPELGAELYSSIYRSVLEHPYYDPERIRLVAGGRALAESDWTPVVARETRGSNVLAIASYAVDALSRYSTVEDRYQSLFADFEGFMRGAGAMARAAAGSASAPMQLAIYETNTHLLGAPREVASEVCASLGAGVAVLDKAMGAMAELGAAPVVYFQLMQRHHDQRLGLWGNVLSQDDGSLRPRPVWLGLELANRYLIEGDMVEADVRGSPVFRHRANGTVPDLRNVPYLHAYAFLSESEDGRGVNVLVVNRHLSESLPVTFELPFAAASIVEHIALTGGAVDANNEESMEVDLQKGAIEDWADGQSVPIPPFSAVVFRFREAA